MPNCWCCYVSPQLIVTSQSLYSVSGSELVLARFRGVQPREDCHPPLRKWSPPVFAQDLPPPMSDLALSQNQRDPACFNVFKLSISSEASVYILDIYYVFCYRYVKWGWHLWYILLICDIIKSYFSEMYDN